MNLNYNLYEYIQDPYNPIKNFNVGMVYFDMGHTASALSFFLRTAEFSTNDDLSYEALILAGQCLAKQNRRHNSEMGIYLQAVRLIPTRPEAYYFISVLHERKSEWLECFTNAEICDTFSINAKKTLSYLNYNSVYSAKFQKAVSAWWIGQIDLSASLFYELADKYGDLLSDFYKKIVLSNINNLGLYNHSHLIYNSNNYNSLKFKFKNSAKVTQNYSQAMQDMFVLTMLNGKEKGTFVEIGAGDSFYGSNTALLDTVFGWSGISVEMNDAYKNDFLKNRNSKLILNDATKLNYSEIFEKNNLPKYIDYLQLDCEPAGITYDVLTKIPFDQYKFAVITYEHDEYTGDAKYKELSRKFLLSKGYVLVVDNVAPDRLCSFEDWWIHPYLVDQNIVQQFKVISNKAKKPTDFMYL